MKRLSSIILLPLLLHSSCSNPQTDSPVKQQDEVSVRLTEAQFKNAGIKTGQLQPGTIHSTIQLKGRIDVPPQYTVSVSAPLGGYVKYTHLLPGMHVNKGDVLAVMEDIQYIQLQQDYLTGKAQLTLAESEYHRQTELNSGKAASDKVLEQARATCETQRILVRSLEEKLKLIGLDPSRIQSETISREIRLHAPITGIIAAANANTGKYVDPGEVVFELLDPRHTFLVLTAFEKDLPLLSPGQKLLAYSNTRSHKKYPCTIMMVGKNLSKDRATEVYCRFEQPDEGLLPGMFMNADVEVTTNVAFTLPEEAVVRFDQKNHVFIQTGERMYQMVAVHTGSSQGGLVEITDGGTLRQQTIVVRGAYHLLMALKNKGDE